MVARGRVCCAGGRGQCQCGASVAVQHCIKHASRYVHNLTQETRWTLPTSTAASGDSGSAAAGNAASSEAHSDWRAVTAEDGNTYYVHNVSQETRWTLPPTSTAASGDSGSAAASIPALPTGWEAIDSGAGSVYYSCASTGETSWTRPEAPQLTAAAVDVGVAAAGAAAASEAHADWSAATAEDGSTYYLNASTQETRWTLPE